YRVVETAAILPTTELGLAGRTGNGDRVRAIGHQITLRHTELNPEIRGSERRPLDNALSRIVVDGDALDLAKESIPIADSGAEPAGRSRFGERTLHAILAQGMRARPFGGLAVGSALHPGFEGARPAEGGENSGCP